MEVGARQVHVGSVTQASIHVHRRAFCMKEAQDRGTGGDLQDDSSLQEKTSVNSVSLFDKAP